MNDLKLLTCQDCTKYKDCKSPCVFIDKLAGKGKPTREKLPPPEPTSHACNYCDIVQECNGICQKTDYKERLSNIQQSRQSLILTSIKEVREIPDINYRAIASMLYSNIQIKDIAFLLDKSERTIRRMCGMP